VIGRLLREPLLQFFVLGALVFLIASLRDAPGGREPSEPRPRIVVGPAQLEHLTIAFERTWQRAPTAAEIAALVDDWVHDEVYYREAMALGLDRDDEVVRRRLREKMEFLVEDAMVASPPTEAELAAHLAAHPDSFRREPVLTFRQVFLDRERRGARIADDARDLVAILAAAGPDADLATAGDRLMLPNDLATTDAREVAGLFGDDFAAALASVEPGAWTGPLPSAYGLHVVFLRSRVAGGVPPLAEVRDAVAADLARTQRTAMVASAYERLRAKYDVVVTAPAAPPLPSP
jgi:hypothetical protein